MCLEKARKPEELRALAQRHGGNYTVLLRILRSGVTMKGRVTWELEEEGGKFLVVDLQAAPLERKKPVMRRRRDGNNQAQR